MLTSDSFTGLRALLVESKYRTSRRKRNRRHLAFGMEQAGRWSVLRTNDAYDKERKFDRESLIILQEYSLGDTESYFVRYLSGRISLLPGGTWLRFSEFLRRGVK